MADNKEPAFAFGPYLALAGVIFAFSFLKKFEFLPSETSLQWLVSDYISRISEFAVILACAPLRYCVSTSFGAFRGRFENLALFRIRLTVSVLFSAILVTTTNHSSDYFTFSLLPDIQIFVYPKIDSIPLAWFDLTFGLALVAINEEFVFRSIVRRFLRQFTENQLVIVLVSAVVFAAAHWSLGLHSIIAGFFAGIVFMILYLKTGSILPSIFAHYLVNVFVFYSIYFG